MSTASFLFILYNVCRMCRYFLLLFVFYLLSGFNVLAGNITHYQIYTTADGLSHRVVRDILQDRKGYLWMATWNGLCQYDGCEFSTYNKLDDGQLIGRLGSIAETENGGILCRTPQNKCYLFDPVTKRFSVPASQAFPKKQIKNPYVLKAVQNGITISDSRNTFFLSVPTKKDLSTTLHASCTDRNGNLWVNCNDVLYKISFPNEQYQYYTHIQDTDSPIYATEIRAFLHMEKEFWLAGKNGRIYMYDLHRNFIGYLSPRGDIQREPVSFGANIYSMELRHGNVWMASKGGGLFMLTPKEEGRYEIRRWTDFEGDSSIYSFAFDDRQNLWIGTYHNGLYKIAWQPNYDSLPQRVDTVAGIRHITMIDGHIAVASKKGLLIYDKDGRLEQRLCHYDCSYIYATQDGTVYVSTMGFGLHKLVIRNGKWELESFKIPSVSSEIVLSVAEDTDGVLYFIKDDSFFKYSAGQQVQIFGSNYFGRNMTFSEAAAFIRERTLWVGTVDGYLTMHLNDLSKNNPSFCWKEILVDTLHLHTDITEIEASEGQEIRISPIVLDYGYMGKIQYKYRLNPDSVWIPLAEREPIVLNGLKNGEYLLEVQYTDSKGIWSAEITTLSIDIDPPFKRKMLYAGFAVVLLVSLCLVIYYRKRRRQINFDISSGTVDGQTVGLKEEEDERFLRKAEDFVRQNIANDNLTVDFLGEYLGLSRSLLYRRMKESVNKTPAQFIKDIRIREAERLLKSQKYTIAEIADMTGFCDPKYFSRVFKKETGKVPTTYLKEQE